MEKPRPNETLRDFIERREPELVQQIHELHKLLAPKEHELSEIRRTKAALGIGSLKPAAASAVDRAVEMLASREETCRALGAALRHGQHQKMTIQELIVFSFAHHFTEATPAEIGGHIRRSYGRHVGDGSVRPNLSRLENKGVLMRNAGRKWELDPVAIKIISSSINEKDNPERDDLMTWARENAWTAEDDAAAERAEIERRLKQASDVALARELKARGLFGKVPGDNSAEAPTERAPSSTSEIAQKGKGSGRRGALPAAPSGGT
jgi:hypothetical protein